MVFSLACTSILLGTFSFVDVVFLLYLLSSRFDFFFFADISTTFAMRPVLSVTIDDFQ